MKYTQQALFTLALLPVLLCGAFLLWFVNNSPEDLIPAAFLFMSLLITASVTIHHIRIMYTEPLVHLAQQLDEPALSVNAQLLYANSPIRHIASSLQALIKQKEDTHRDQIALLNADHQRLRRSESLHKKYQHERTRQNKIDECLINLSKPLLDNFIAYNNLIKCESTAELKSDLDFCCEQILFLLQEFQEHPYGSLELIPIDIYNEIDEAIEILHPLLNRNDIDITPIFDLSCPQKSNLTPNSFKALVFHFILFQLIQNDLIGSSHQSTTQSRIRSRTNQLFLDVKSLFRRDIDISIYPLPNTNLDNLSSRLSTLVNFFELSFSDGRMCIPLQNIEADTPIVSHDRAAQVFADDKLHKASLEKRLKKLGFLIVDDDHKKKAVDLCFIAKKEHEEIILLAGNQSPDTLVLLMCNQQYYLEKNWYQLSFPLRHKALCQIITDHYSPKIFDHDLALKRADNRPELMKELLAILLESLLEDMQSLEAALRQNNLASLRELLHKINGALRYSGTAKLSHSVKKFSDIAKNDARSKYNNNLLKKAFSDVKKDMHELEQWYKKY